MRLMIRISLLILTPLPILATGCSSSDERLARFAQESVESQKQQNEAQARQNGEMMEACQRLTEASQDLVAQDAEARQELIEAQRVLHQGLQAEQTNLDRQREKIADEKRELTTMRNRDPIVAASIENVGALLVCLTPLLVCLTPLLVCCYALYAMNRKCEGADIGELLIDEFTTEQPRFLPALIPPVIPVSPSLTDESSESDLSITP